MLLDSKLKMAAFDTAIKGRRKKRRFCSSGKSCRRVTTIYWLI